MGIIFAETLTAQDPVFFPEFDVAVIVAAPFIRAVTFPFASTEATEGLLELHATDLSVASAGETETESWLVSPSVREREEGLTLTPVTFVLDGSFEQETTRKRRVVRI